MARPSDKEALRLFSAFHRIADPRKRGEIIALAELAARQSPVVDNPGSFPLVPSDSPTADDPKRPI